MPPSGTGWSPKAGSTTGAWWSPGPGSGSASATGSPPAATTATCRSPTATCGRSPRVDRNGGLLVTPDGTPHVTPAAGVVASVTPAVTPAGTGARVLPADYVTAHVELAYATTAHGTQGDTVTAAHLVVGEDTGAAAAYVGMTRGRTANTAHLVATDPAEAREQWLAVFARDRADLGPAHAARLAAAEAARYAQPRPLEQALADLHSAWTAEQRCLDRLAHAEPRPDALREIVALESAHADRARRADRRLSADRDRRPPRHGAGRRQRRGRHRRDRPDPRHAARQLGHRA